MAPVSTATHETDKSELLAKAVDLAQHGKGTGGPPHDQVDDLLRSYDRLVAAEDVLDRSDANVYGSLASHY